MGQRRRHEEERGDQPTDEPGRPSGYICLAEKKHDPKSEKSRHLASRAIDTSL